MPTLRQFILKGKQLLRRLTELSLYIFHKRSRRNNRFLICVVIIQPMHSLRLVFVHFSLSILDHQYGLIFLQIFKINIARSQNAAQSTSQRLSMCQVDLTKRLFYVYVVTIWVLKFVTIWVLSFVTIWVFAFCHNLSWVCYCSLSF